MARNGRKKPESSSDPPGSEGGTAVLDPPPDAAVASPEAATEGTPPGVSDGTPAAAGNRPVKTFTVPAGSGVTVQASCWARQITYDGREITVYSVSVRKSYRDDASGEWKNTTSFRSSELHLARHVLQAAETWCLAQRQTEDPPF